MSGGVHGKGGRFKRKEVGADRVTAPGDAPAPPPPPEGLQLPSLEGLPGVTIEVLTSLVKKNHKWGARSAGRGNVNKYRTRVAFRVRDCTSGVVQSATYSSRPDLEAAVARLRAARGVALGVAAGIEGAPGAGAAGSPAGGAGSGAAATPPQKRFATPFVLASTTALAAAITSCCATCGARGERGSGSGAREVQPPAQPSPTPPPFAHTPARPRPRPHARVQKKETPVLCEAEAG